MDSNESIFNDSEFYEQKFENLQCQNIKLEGKVFENCVFSKVDFSESQLTKCKFVDCEFIACNLSSAQFDNSLFSEVAFNESKLLGINWCRLRWPLVKLSAPLYFYKSNISHGVLLGLELNDLVIEECKAHDVDFREADLSGASLTNTDFYQSQFMRTKLRAADFTDATNYNIDPTENDIRKAKFSLPDAMNLLNGFEIEIID